MHRLHLLPSVLPRDEKRVYVVVLAAQISPTPAKVVFLGGRGSILASRKLTDFLVEANLRQSLH
jgi:hypothetical protein